MKTLEITQPVKTNGQIFTSVVKGKNFMTPDLLGYYKVSNGEAELTEGTNFDHDPIFGVTIVMNGNHDCDASRCFDTKQEALNYISSFNHALRQEIRTIKRPRGTHHAFRRD